MLGSDAMGKQVVGGPALVSPEMVDDHRWRTWRDGDIESMVADVQRRRLIYTTCDCQEDGILD